METIFIPFGTLIVSNELKNASFEDNHAAT